MPTPGRRMSRRLVITADDLGRDEATDATITSLAADGLITATSLIVLSPHAAAALGPIRDLGLEDRKSTRLNSSHVAISYAVFCLKKKSTRQACRETRLAHARAPPRTRNLRP